MRYWVSPDLCWIELLKIELFLHLTVFKQMTDFYMNWITREGWYSIKQRYQITDIYIHTHTHSVILE